MNLPISGCEGNDMSGVEGNDTSGVERNDMSGVEEDPLPPDWGSEYGEMVGIQGVGLNMTSADD